MNKIIELCTELAPKLNEYRGEWQVGDDFKSIHSYAYMTVLDIRPSRFRPDLKGNDQLLGDEWWDSEDCIWIPREIDRQDRDRIARGEKPRGLWRMVDWNFVTHVDFTEEGDLNIGKWDYGVEDWVWSTGYCDPTEALLLALQAQWEVKP